MKKILGLIGLFCFFCSFVVAQGLGIQGVVYDATTGDVLPSAELKIIEAKRFEVTNKTGRYLFSDLPKGNYSITVSYVGYASQTKKVNLKDKTVTLHFELQELSTELDEVVVTGTGTMHHIQNVPLMTEVVGKKFLSMYAGQSLQEILAGLSPSFDFNQNIMGANIQMNGLGNQYILILVNGERISDEQNVLGVINPSEIEKIEIVKGASSSLYGSDAIAGVINVITKKEKAKISVQNNTRVANYATVQQNNSLSLAKGKWRSTTQFNLKHTDGWQNTKEEKYRERPLYTNSVTKTVNRFTDWKIGEKIEFKPNKKFSANIQGGFYKKEIDRPTGEPQYVVYGMEYRNQAYAARAKYNYNEKIDFSFNANYDETRYFHNYTKPFVDEYITPEGRVTHPIRQAGEHIQEYKKNRFLVHGKGIFTFNDKQTFSTGIEFKQHWLTSPNRLPDEKEANYLLAAYLQDEYNITEYLNVTGGVRLTKHEIFGVHLTPKLSVLKKWGHFNFRGTWSQGFKTPSIKELHYHYKRTMMSKLRLYLGNEDLKPETSNYFSLATEYKNPNFSLSVTTYLNKLKDMITLMEVPTPYEEKIKDRELDMTMQYKNIEDATIKGIEVIAKYNLPQNIKVGGSYSYLEANGNFLNEDNQIEETIINGTAHHRANFYALWNHKWEKYTFGVGFFGKGQSKRYYREYGNADAYTTFRINTEHKFLNFRNYDIEFNAGIDNLLDYKETKPYGYNYATKTSGRTFYISLFINFKK